MCMDRLLNACDTARKIREHIQGDTKTKQNEDEKKKQMKNGFVKYYIPL